MSDDTGSEPPTLVVTVGLPRAGKSTWARTTGYPVVNPDAIRLALHGQRFAGPAEPMVWVLAKYMVRALFRAGHAVVVLDATSVTRARRAEWVSKEYRTRIRPFRVPRAVCRERAAADPELLGVIDRMAAEFEPPGSDEPEWVDPPEPPVDAWLLLRQIVRHLAVQTPPAGKTGRRVQYVVGELAGISSTKAAALCEAAGVPADTFVISPKWCEVAARWCPACEALYAADQPCPTCTD